MQMKFDHILEAILYSQLTGDQESLEKYVGEHIDKMAQLVKSVDSQMENDDIIFYLAFLKPWLDLRMQMLEEPERELVEMVSSSIKMVGVKIPMDMLPDGMPPEGPLS